MQQIFGKLNLVINGDPTNSLARVKHFSRPFWLLLRGRTCLTGLSRTMQVWRGKMGRRRLLRGGINVMGGKVTHQAVAEAHGMKWSAAVV